MCAISSTLLCIVGAIGIVILEFYHSYTNFRSRPFLEDTQLVTTIRLIRDLLGFLCTSSDDCIPGSKKVR